MVIAVRRWNGHVASGAGAFVVLNDDGWIVTAAHTFDLWQTAERDAPLVAEHLAKVAEVEADSSLRAEAKNRQLKRLRGEAKADWITHHSFWWAQDGVSIRDLTLVGDADIAVGRLDPYAPATGAQYPTIKNPAVGMRQGRSLCRLGFPFHQIDVKFDRATSAFAMSQQFTFFPLDGIFTRTVEVASSAAGKYPLKFVETSSPGLMGQSGGPLFDVGARIWGIQSRTKHVALGFKTVENQVINLGDAVHCETLVAILTDLGVPFDLSAD